MMRSQSGFVIEISDVFDVEPTRHLLTLTSTPGPHDPSGLTQRIATPFVGPVTGHGNDVRTESTSTGRKNSLGKRSSTAYERDTTPLERNR